MWARQGKRRWKKDNREVREEQRDRWTEEKRKGCLSPVCQHRDRCQPHFPFEDLLQELTSIACLGWNPGLAPGGRAGSSLTTLSVSPAGSEDEEEVAATSPRRTVFSRALQAGELHWNDSHLQRILASDSCGPSLTGHVGGDKPTFDLQGHPIWLGEPFPTACARVDTLRAHGYPHKALRLACAIINTLRLQRRHQLESYKQQRKGEWDAGAQGTTRPMRVCELLPQGRKESIMEKHCALGSGALLPWLTDKEQKREGLG